MRSTRAATMIAVGYCTNVYPGTTFAAVLENIKRFARDFGNLCPTAGVRPIGLWLSESVVDELKSPALRERLKDSLAEHQLWPQTLNGFPQGDFHQPVVKHLVYQPTWAEPARLTYTQNLAELLAELLIELRGPDQCGTISTLPIAWGLSAENKHVRLGAAAQLKAFAEFAHALYEQTGAWIRLCLEPEPGCMLSVSQDAVDFFSNELLRREREETRLRRYLAICHDVCHAAVMFESQKQAIDRYRQAGWEIAKIQVSSALVADFGGKTEKEKALMVEHLRRYAEPRYLHQTCIDGREFYNDLPAALKRSRFEGQWRIHFHVPIFASILPGGLSTTRDAVSECIRAMHDRAHQAHWEIETYAWNVLPDPPAPDQLGQAMAREWLWFQQQLNVPRP